MAPRADVLMNANYRFYSEPLATKHPITLLRSAPALPGNAPYPGSYTRSRLFEVDLEDKKPGRSCQDNPAPKLEQSRLVKVVLKVAAVQPSALGRLW